MENEPQTTNHKPETTNQLWEAVLGPAYRDMHPYSQDDVLDAVGQSDIDTCPLAYAYGVEAMPLWDSLTKDDQGTLIAAGVSPAEYEAFIAWHDSADDHALDQLRAWLTAQQEGVAR